jgi:tetratricopeptide (TPR) repeat protein
MNCERVEAEGLVGSYLTGRLDEEGSVALEEHVLGCDRCFEELELARVVRAGFREMEAVNYRPGTSPRLSSRKPLLVAGLALAAVLAGVILLDRGDFGVQQDLTGQVTIGPADLPPYIPVTLRDGADEASKSLFLSGMDAYAREDYEKALEDLKAAVEVDSTLLVRRLYLGASMSVLGRFEDAVPHLRAAARDPALSDDARWLLAKSLIRRGEVDSGRRELMSLSRTGGTHSKAAIDLLAHLADSQPPDTAGN